MRTARKLVAGAFGLAGLKVTRTGADPACEGFDVYLRRARAAGRDVNDWLESELGWEPSATLVDTFIRPLVRPDSCIVEIGSGTGRHARHMAPLVPGGSLVCVDHSPWCRKFLRGYFRDCANVRVAAPRDGQLPASEGTVDLVFSNATFIELKLGTIRTLAREMARILKPGGCAVFDYLDTDREEAWDFLDRSGPELDTCYTYHSGTAMNRVFAGAGFAAGERRQEGKSTYVAFRRDGGSHSRA